MIIIPLRVQLKVFPSSRVWQQIKLDPEDGFYFTVSDSVSYLNVILYVDMTSNFFKSPNQDFTNPLCGASFPRC